MAEVEGMCRRLGSVLSQKQLRLSKVKACKPLPPDRGVPSASTARTTSALTANTVKAWWKLWNLRSSL